MLLEVLQENFSVCRVGDAEPPPKGTYFLSRTDREVSLVCETGVAPEDAERRDDGWRAIRFAGELDFSLTGVLSRLSGILAAEKIGIFAISTYDTDYVLVREQCLQRTRAALEKAGYTFCEI